MEVGTGQVVTVDESFEQTLANARAGDEAAFAALFRDAQPRLVRYLRVLDASVAEDAAADAWLEVATHLQAFEGDEAGFRSWLLTIGRRKLVDRARYDARRPVHLVAADDVGRLDALRPASGGLDQPDPAAVAEEDEATARAVALVRTLPPDQAEVVMLRVVGGLDNAQVAAILGKSPGAVRVLSHRGLRRLARTLRVRSAPAVGAAAADRASEGRASEDRTSDDRASAAGGRRA
jgi:RNA polymerase sigma-70 factor, ECF subfamily